MLRTAGLSYLCWYVGYACLRGRRSVLLGTYSVQYGGTEYGGTDDRVWRVYSVLYSGRGVTYRTEYGVLTGEYRTEGKSRE